MTGTAMGAIGKGSRFATSFVPVKSTLPVFNNKYLANLEFSPPTRTPTIKEAIENVMKGSKQAGEFINSEAVNNSLVRNNALAERIGIVSSEKPYKTPPMLSTKFVDNFQDFINTNSPTGNVENIGALYSGRDNTIYFKKTVTPLVSFHENLHAYGFGKRPIQEFKAKYLFDPDKVKNMTKAQKEYYLGGTEAAVHYAQLGKNYGLSPGQKFPGQEVMDKMFSSTEGPGIYGSAFYSKLNKPRDYKRV
jgi:hypothetical protein